MSQLDEARLDRVAAILDAAAANLPLAPSAFPPVYVPEPPQLRALSVQELAVMRFRHRDEILVPWLHSQDLCMVFAGRGVGKTHYCLAVAFAIATGTAFAKWTAPVARKVLYLDGELPGVVLQKRLLQHCPDIEPADGYFRVFTPDLLPDGVPLPDLSTPAGQAEIDALIEPDTAVVFIDNLSAWARSGRENEAESWIPIADWILRLRRRGLAVVLVHHAGKGGQQRGTSKREDLLDVVISLSHSKDYDPQQGARFFVEFTKARSLSGEDAESIELSLGGTDERASWSWQSVATSNYERIVALAKEGLSQTEIAVELELARSTVNRAMRKARDLGDLPQEAKK